MSDEVDRLLRSVTTLHDRLLGLEQSLGTYRQGVQAESQRLHLEAEVGRVLNRYSRRTWMAMTAGILWFVLNLSDAARAYADNVWWDLLFWPSHHRMDGFDGGFHYFQVIGFTWQAVGLYVLWRRSQVPNWLVDRVRAPKTMTTTKEDLERVRVRVETHEQDRDAE